MVSRPSAYRSSPSGEKTGSCWASGLSASHQSDDSSEASRAIAAQRSAVAAEPIGGLHGAVDVLVRMRQRDEHGLELGRRNVDATVEEVAEVRAVPFGVTRLRVVEVPYASIGHEEREHRAHPAHAPEPCQAGLEPRTLAFELGVHRLVAEPA